MPARLRCDIICSTGLQASRRHDSVYASPCKEAAYIVLIIYKSVIGWLFMMIFSWFYSPLMKRDATTKLSQILSDNNLVYMSKAFDRSVKWWHLDLELDFNFLIPKALFLRPVADFAHVSYRRTFYTTLLAAQSFCCANDFRFETSWCEIIKYQLSVELPISSSLVYMSWEWPDLYIISDIICMNACSSFVSRLVLCWFIPWFDM